MENFEVLYTKHFHQKIKTWEDGHLEYHVKPMKLILYDVNDRSKQCDSKFYKSPPDLSPGEEIRMNKFMLEIVSHLGGK